MGNVMQPKRTALPLTHDPQTRSSKPLDTFTYFSKLSPECRTRVWRFASQVQRNVILDLNASIRSTHSPDPTPGVPAVLHTTFESRHEALKHYSLCHLRPRRTPKECIEWEREEQEEYMFAEALTVGKLKARGEDVKARCIFVNFDVDLFVHARVPKLLEPLTAPAVALPNGLQITTNNSSTQLIIPWGSIGGPGLPWPLPNSPNGLHWNQYVDVLDYLFCSEDLTKIKHLTMTWDDWEDTSRMRQIELLYKTPGLETLELVFDDENCAGVKTAKIIRKLQRDIRRTRDWAKQNLDNPQWLKEAVVTIKNLRGFISEELQLQCQFC